VEQISNTKTIHDFTKKLLSMQKEDFIRSIAGNSGIKRI